MSAQLATTTAPALTPFVDQQTVALTTYRRDGTPVNTPVSIAIDGDRAFIRTYEKAWKVRRMRNNPEVEVAPSTQRGEPTGPAIHARAKQLDAADSLVAAHALARKQPLLQGVLVPLTHRLFRFKFGKTVHFELIPA
jgi:PPOX class probable F420-dependent enzyme